ncbi:MAG TPA: hypothetical protein VI911_11585 [Patescibacteria group bacterium]|nr:hypothetical protein [Patescibacteria group bacterium]
MSKLVEIMAKIKQNKDIVNTKIDTENPHTLRGLESKARRAKEDLNDLFIKYRAAVQCNCAFILITGSLSDEFAKISKEKFDCFTLDGEDFYKTLLKEVSPRIYMNKLAGSSMFDILSSTFESIAYTIGITGYKSLIPSAKFNKIIKSEKEALNVVVKSFNEGVGAEVAGLYYLDKATVSAIDSDFEGTIIPIMIQTENTDLIKDFAQRFRQITKNVFIVTVGSKLDKELKEVSIYSSSKITEEGVEKALTSVREQI